MSSWGCPHELDGRCMRVNNVACDPGMKGCVLSGRFVWSDESKNRPARPRRGKAPKPSLEPKPSPDDDDKRLRR
jgi:hypothetical protein